ncbi:MAG TPA: AMP-binding protein, partial [Myxococcales bacterium]
MGRYEEMFRRSLEDPDGFWSEAARPLRRRKKWERVLDKSRPDLPQWFQGGLINTCENALDVHVEGGRAEQLALIWDSAVTNSVAKFTYRQLRDEVALFAGALARLGVVKGDRVILYMPMVPEAVVAMLACARIGAVHSVVFGGFAAKELATRIEDAKPKLIFSASCGLEPGRIVQYKPLLDEAIKL